MRQSLRINQYIFQSTLPLRGATRSVYDQRVAELISIHTPLAGSDSCEIHPTELGK